MQSKTRVSHSIDAVFSVLIFGIFILFLLMMILFSAEAYRASAKNLEKNQNLHTAMTYLTTKVRQHDGSGDVFSGSIEDHPALCLKDEINGQDFTTYIYLDGTVLKELFAVPGASVSASLGTAIAELKDFRFEQTPSGFLCLSLEDTSGEKEELLLHPELPLTTFKEEPV